MRLEFVHPHNTIESDILRRHRTKPALSASCSIWTQTQVSLSRVNAIATQNPSTNFKPIPTPEKSNLCLGISTFGDPALICRHGCDSPCVDHLRLGPTLRGFNKPRPRAATSVATNTVVRPVLKSDKTRSRSLWSLSPWIALHRTFGMRLST